ncbi:unnamed protein product [Auanema sp. JU1783]|nr:unnamed protein product [Auanema sp. JU1783]
MSRGVFFLVLCVCLTSTHGLTLIEASEAREAAVRNIHLLERPIIKDIPSSPKVRVNWDGHVFVAGKDGENHSPLRSTFSELFEGRPVD